MTFKPSQLMRVVAAVTIGLHMNLIVPLPALAASLSAEKCNALKQKSFGKFYFGLMKTYARALQKGTEPSLIKERAKLDAALARLEPRCGGNFDQATNAETRLGLERVALAFAKSTEAGLPGILPAPGDEFTVLDEVGNRSLGTVTVGNTDYSVEVNGVAVMVNVRIPDHGVADFAVRYLATVGGQARQILYGFRFVASDPDVWDRTIVVGEPGGDTHYVDRTTWKRVGSLDGNFEDALAFASFTASGEECETFTGEFIETGAPAVRALCPDGTGNGPSAALLFANPAADDVIGLSRSDSKRETGRLACPWCPAVLAIIEAITVIGGGAIFAGELFGKEECVESYKQTTVCTPGGMISESPGLMSQGECTGVICGGVCCDKEKCASTETKTTEYK